MRKNLLLTAASVALLAACSSDDTLVTQQQVQNDTKGQELTICLEAGGDGMTTRAGRKLESSEAAQSIDHVKVLVLSENYKKIVFAKEFSNWNTTDGADYGSATDGAVDHGKYATINFKTESAFKADGGLPVGKYHVYAIGWNAGANGAENDTYTFDPTSAAATTTWNNSGEGAETWQKVIATMKNINGAPEEIFAGGIGFNALDAWYGTTAPTRDYTELEVIQEGSGSAVTKKFKNANYTIYLHRQVAGAFAYLKNIPCYDIDGVDAGDHLRLVASGRNSALHMYKFNDVFRTTGANSLCVINANNPSTSPQADAMFKGSTAADGYTVFEIQLSDWFKGTTGTGACKMDLNNDGVLNVNDAASTNWTIPSTFGTGFNCVRGSVFASNFIIPFGHKGTKTFELQLTKGTGTNAEILRAWTVKLEYEPTAAHITNETEVAASGDRSIYSIVRNHLYTIGKKTDRTGGGGDTPDPDEEDPEDLNKGQVLTLRVNDNWEMVNRMVVEEEM